MDGVEQLQGARQGSIVTIHEGMDFDSDELGYFMKLSDYGRKKDCILLESADVITKYGEKSIGSASPCVKVRGRGRNFEVIALNPLGEKFLQGIRGNFGFCKNVKVSAAKISGQIPLMDPLLSEGERLRAITMMDVLRKVAFGLSPANRPFTVSGGLMGAIAYDFIDQFENLPQGRKDVLKEPDFEMNFYDNLFIVDHLAKKISFVANAMLFDGSREEKDFELSRCAGIIKSYKDALHAKMPVGKMPAGKKSKVSSDTSRQGFMKMVSRLKKNVLCGDVFQAVASRTLIAPFTAEPLDIYLQLRSLNPSPYMFYFNSGSGILLGSSPETFLKVESSPDGPRMIEIRPIAGTKPRGFDAKGNIDPDLDSRFEAELKNDPKELAEHTMLIDLARNDVARVSEPGSRVCENPYTIVKYSHVQHLVSTVRGRLKGGLDALHAYLASMNMGTLTGAPKVEAMKLLRRIEKTRRGFYGGSIGYLTPSGDFDCAIIIRSMKLQNGKAYIRAGAGIVHDSVPEQEFLETERKARACLEALEIAERGK
ncbi:MAG TPA: anthranilate synthase component 1 [Candidatus Diapherotrites archaeon]|uniref:anthranilate synthase n=1 Tax=Candidatus Iainarchaeum sp. TaxID=3101447 RepID=A0A7J4IWC7_9ARCH|nr:anthranilate synthase component 1 [Candidatus Diapherotrites archaeon]